MEALGTLGEERKFWSARRVFVTGATGAVGSWVTKDLLERGATVVALVMEADSRSELYRSGRIQRVRAVYGRLEDFSTLERALAEYEVDTVIHLGAQAIVGTADAAPLETFESNVRGTWNLLDACRRRPKAIQRIVIASSDKAYGEHDHLPYTEDMPLKGRGTYEVSKSCADMIARAYYHTFGLPVVIARCGNVYGGGDLNWSRIVPGTIRSLYQGESPQIRCDGQYVRDYLYVMDVSRAYLSLAAHMDSREVCGESFNFGADSRLTVLQVVDEISRLMKCQHLKPIVLNKAQGEIRSQFLCSAKAARVLQWKPAYSLEEGLRETIQWYKQFFSENDS
jgi:CDP-glucose 4,6-dehydratase